MYQISAVFNKMVLREVLEDLESMGISGVTIVDVVDKDTFLKETTSTVEAKVMLTIVVSSDYYREIAMEAIRANTMDLSVGSGKMWITTVSDVERIRTGEKGADALSNVVETKSKGSYFEKFYELDTPAT
ncbi:MAG: hypothetical protein K0U47_09020 [Epsilonproteobacteria bacterium]|nr:hypothetical protein [Campylobacterota bacterium]